MQVNILDAKNRLSQLIKSAQAGEDVVIANRGEPVARLVSTSTPSSVSANPGSAAAFLGWLAEHPLPAHHQRTHTEIEAGISDERGAWD
jgi:prevent-host-death family protein